LATLYIAGAGFSYGTLQGHHAHPPIARDFLQELCRRSPSWEIEFPNLKLVADYLAGTHVGLEEIWTCIDFHAKFPFAFPIPWIKPRGPVVGELKSALLRLYGRNCDALAERLASDPDANCTAVRIAREVRAGDTVVSFNYDTVFERLIRRFSGVRLRHGMRLVADTIRFAKPHGSASWPIGDLRYELTQGDAVLDSCAEGEDPLLLGAVPIKSELIFEVAERYNRRVFEVILEQWRTLSAAMSQVDRVVVLGYRFPPEDTYGRGFFREGLKQRPPSVGYQVDVYNRDADLQLVHAVFPSATSICFRGPMTAAVLRDPDVVRREGGQSLQ